LKTDNRLTLIKTQKPYLLLGLLFAVWTRPTHQYLTLLKLLLKTIENRAMLKTCK